MHEQVEHRALDDLAARAAAIFDDRPAAVLFAVLLAPVAFEEDDGAR
jgi:hypothetical protein